MHTHTNRSDDSLEDGDYIKVRDYINSLEANLVEAHRQAARLIKKETELNGALEEFGHAAEQLVRGKGRGVRRGCSAVEKGCSC
jgi:sorting nexin-1/2